MASLEFPFVALDPAEKAFNVCPNKNELLEQCPDVSPEWISFGENFQLGIFTSAQLGKLSMIADDLIEARQKIEFIYCVAGSFAFSCEEKSKILGWLFSLCLEECPV